MHCRRNCIPDTILRRQIDSGTDSPNAKRMKPSDDPNVYTRHVAFYRNHFDNKNMPKCVLNTHATKLSLDIPTYETKQIDRLFQSVITFQGQKYASSYWEKSKRFAEQGAALVCILGLGLVSEENLLKSGSLTK